IAPWTDWLHVFDTCTLSVTVCVPRLTTPGSTWKRSITRRAGDETSATFAGPFPAGQPVTGAFGAAVTSAVGTDVADDDPLEFRAVTRTRSVLSLSTVFRVYVLSVAPLIVEQLPPSLSHRSHRNSNVNGWVPSHEPGDAVSVDPSRVVPLTVGGAVFVGAVV